MIHKVRVIWEAVTVVDVEAPTEAAARKYVRDMALPFDQDAERFDFTVRLNNDDCDCDSCRDDEDEEEEG